MPFFRCWIFFSVRFYTQTAFLGGAFVVMPNRFDFYIVQRCAWAHASAPLPQITKSNSQRVYSHSDFNRKLQTISNFLIPSISCGKENWTTTTKEIRDFFFFNKPTNVHISNYNNHMHAHRIGLILCKNQSFILHI